MSGASSSWPLLLRVFGHILGGVILYGVAILFWEIAVGDWKVFGIFSIIFAFSGFICFVKALVVFLQFVWKWFRHRAFLKRGKALKADKVADVDDLRRRGLIK